MDTKQTNLFTNKNNKLTTINQPLLTNQLYTLVFYIIFNDAIYMVEGSKDIPHLYNHVLSNYQPNHLLQLVL